MKNHFLAIALLCSSAYSFAMFNPKKTSQLIHDYINHSLPADSLICARCNKERMRFLQVWIFKSNKLKECEYINEVLNDQQPKPTNCYRMREAIGVILNDQSDAVKYNECKNVYATASNIAKQHALKQNQTNEKCIYV